MTRIDTELEGVCILEPKVFGDARGYFFEAYNERVFASQGLPTAWVQDNASRSARGVLRGLHYQLGKPQGKLVRVTRGEVFDVAVDVRRGSPTFGRALTVVLSEENRRAVYIPPGFAHGFYVLSEIADFLYKVTDFYDPKEERGIAWSDPALGITWPIIAGTEPVLSAKDRVYGPLAGVDEKDLPTLA